jgi:hypothetical protein
MEETIMQTMTLDRKKAARLNVRFNRKKADAERLIYPRVAALEMQDDFLSIARQLAPRDPSTQDDLVQEMALAVILSDQPQTRSAFRLLAGWRASDYLRWWRNLPPDPGEKKPGDDAPPPSQELDQCCQALNRLLGNRTDNS